MINSNKYAILFGALEFVQTIILQFVLISWQKYLTLSRPDIFFVSDLALSLEYDRAWQMKHCLCLQFPCKVNNLVEKGLLYGQRMDVGGH